MAQGSMKNAVNCENECELQNTLNIDFLNAYCGPRLVLVHVCLSVGFHPSFMVDSMKGIGDLKPINMAAFP